ncbi:hypothetical protein CDCA_CDCA20G4822 [Cyanidium caldarium]|uniref:Elongator complex protein 5 n=1 Tax=Cyanidium caldarium TaxID=2771 RepID=A0AAV9J2J1_CYACA|nr:hypothetical protein CDCA_CDCA20G4822 [Cyanidium caldarium]|eukprot:ctg_726.g392
MVVGPEASLWQDVLGWEAPSRPPPLGVDRRLRERPESARLRGYRSYLIEDERLAGGKLLAAQLLTEHWVSDAFVCAVASLDDPPEEYVGLARQLGANAGFSPDSETIVWLVSCSGWHDACAGTKCSCSDATSSKPEARREVLRPPQPSGDAACSSADAFLDAWQQILRRAHADARDRRKNLFVLLDNASTLGLLFGKSAACAAALLQTCADLAAAEPDVAVCVVLLVHADVEPTTAIARLRFACDTVLAVRALRSGTSAHADGTLQVCKGGARAVAASRFLFDIGEHSIRYWSLPRASE